MTEYCVENILIIHAGSSRNWDFTVSK
jgi:hypothetical protein